MSAARNPWRDADRMRERTAAPFAAPPAPRWRPALSAALWFAAGAAAALAWAS